jgi:2-hydroxychromene-2-carboxylate isomerase
VCKGHTVEPWPVLFAAMLDKHGTVGPAEVPAKRIYTFKDAYRKAHAFGLPPLVPPPAHPFNPLLALRVASLPMDEGDRKRLIDALYAAAWAKGTGIETPEQIIATINAIGLDGASLVNRAPEAKELLRTRTDKAIAFGVFGVPTAMIDEEIFWGVDALPFITAKLEGRDPISSVPLERWVNLPASAQRKR